MSNILEIKDLHVSYGGINAVKGVSFSVPEGKIVTLVGSNGAGKSTVLRSVAGIVKPQSGSIVFDGTELIGLSADKIVAKGVTLVPEGRRVFANLAVLENLKIGAYLRKDKLDDSIAYVYRLFPRLEERSWQLAGTLSGGEQQMLAMGRGLMANPKLLLLDEPSMGLAPILVDEIFEIIKKINEDGTTILLVEQNAFKAMSIANRVYILETGSISSSGNSSDMIKDPAVKAAYLGG